MNTDRNSHQAADAFIERMGLSAEADGLPRIAGRMWGFFIIHGGPCSFAELAERLQVSRGSISTNARILRDLGILERVAKAGDRQDYYQLSNEPYTRMLEGYAARMRDTVHSAHQAASDLPTEWIEAKQRLADMQVFYTSAVTTTEQLINELRGSNDNATRDFA